jgi:hypothetical protein
MKSGAGAPGVSNSVHGRAERTQCSRRPARGLSQAACQHRSHSTAHSFAARAAARVAIPIAINDRSFVETAQARHRPDPRGTRPFGMTLARVVARVRDWTNGQCHADTSGQPAGRSCRRVAERGRRPQSTHEYRISGRYGRSRRRRAQYPGSAHAAAPSAGRGAGGQSRRARPGNRARQRFRRRLGSATTSAASGQGSSLSFRCIRSRLVFATACDSRSAAFTPIVVPYRRGRDDAANAHLHDQMR